MKLPVISLAILASQAFLASYQSADFKQKLNAFQSYYTGVDLSDGKFHPERLVVGYAPWLTKRFIMPIARPRLPVRGLPISLS